MPTQLNYKECCNWLYKQFASFQNTGGTAYKPGLERIKHLMEHFENAHNSYAIVHIAGTNGKGSTSHLLHSVFMEAGYKTGLFSSPHMLDFKERIRINGSFISEDFVCNFVNKNKIFFEEGSYSFFEITLALALVYFAEKEIDVLILETGLGGRLDATNIVNPLLSVITNVSMDHEGFLGNSIREIAREKAGIIKRDIPVVIGEYQEEIADIFEKKATEENANLVWARNVEAGTIPYKVQLFGSFQQKNAHTGWVASQMLKQQFNLKDEHILKGFQRVQENVFLPGRWQKVAESPTMIFDMAHNEGAVQELLMQLNQETYEKLHIVWAMMEDKQVDSIVKMLPVKAEYYLCSPENKRAMQQEELQGYFKKNKLSCRPYNSAVEALTDSVSKANKNDLILVAGSAYLLAELFEKYFRKSVGELKFISIFATP